VNPIMKLLDRLANPPAGKFHGVMGVYFFVDDAAVAVRSLHTAGYRQLSVFSPIPHHEIEHQVAPGPSGVRWCTFAGGALGFTGGMALCIWSAYSYPLVVGGKELASLPPYMIPTYESMILLGGLTNLIAMLAFGRLPVVKPRAPYDPRFTEDRIGIWVPCRGEDAKKVEQILRGTKAEEVQLHA
jgi:hypothetical protein